MKENSLVNNEKDHVLLVLSKVPVQKCFSKHFFRWSVSDKLWDIIANKQLQWSMLYQMTKFMNYWRMTSLYLHVYIKSGNEDKALKTVNGQWSSIQAVFVYLDYIHVPV